MRTSANTAGVVLCALVLLGAGDGPSSTGTARPVGKGQDVGGANPQVDAMRADANATVCAVPGVRAVNDELAYLGVTALPPAPQPGTRGNRQRPEGPIPGG